MVVLRWGSSRRNALKHVHRFFFRDVLGFHGNFQCFIEFFYSRMICQGCKLCR